MLSANGMTQRHSLLCLPFLLLAGPLHSQVVINEIFYHAPDDHPDLQWVELYNTSDQPVNLAGWSLAQGVKFAFAQGATLAPRGYVVICRNRARFGRFYKVPVAGEFEKALKRSGERLDLRNAAGELVDSVTFSHQPPWPISPAGWSASLERICPTAPANGPENWAASPLSPNPARPGGTPGKQNRAFATSLPPVISQVAFQPTRAEPGQAILVEANVMDQAGVASVTLGYRVAGPGAAGEDKALPMTKGSEGSRYSARIPGQQAGQIARFRIQAVNPQSARRFYPGQNEPRSALSCLVFTNTVPGKIPFGYIIHTDAAQSAFVFVDPQTRDPQLFDFVQIPERNGGWKVRFGKDHPLRGMTTINLIFEASDRWLLAEPLAYELHRRAGLAACLTDYVRLWVDGEPVGYHLLIEQPNKSFFRRNGLREDGNLYKATYMGQGVVGQHEKKANLSTGHDDLIQLVDQLDKSKANPAEQWDLIKREFDVAQVINHYAVRMLISDWDGFFNNYFLYHDLKGTRKWTLYPWDEDKTWGEYDGWEHSGLLYNLPLIYGAEGDRPPAWRGNRAPSGFMGLGMGGAFWWRPGGYISRPLLANPTFRKHFLARLKELLGSEFTEARLFPLVDQMRDRLQDEVRFRANVVHEAPAGAQRRFESNLASLKEFITKRRQWLLEQAEIRTAATFDPTQLK